MKLYLAPTPNLTDANKSVQASRANCFHSKENATTRRARGFLKQIYGFARLSNEYSKILHLKRFNEIGFYFAHKEEQNLHCPHIEMVSTD